MEQLLLVLLQLLLLLQLLQVLLPEVLVPIL